MPAITVRNIDDSVKDALRIRAAKHGRSMEQEVREILARAVREEEPSLGLASSIFERFRAEGGIDLPVIDREMPREPITFDE